MRMLSDKQKVELKRLATRIRIETVKQIAALGIGHIGGSLSMAELLAVLYHEDSGLMKVDPKNPHWADRDYLVTSKGHGGPAVYSVLALRGFFPMEWLKTLNRPGTNLPSHTDRLKTPGVDMTTGSLGQGASEAAGIALGHKMDGKDNYTYLVLGDGELDEGQVWEVALFAPQFKLDRLIAFVDYNKQQVDGFTCDIMNLGNIEEKYAAFGWFAQTVDGHDVAKIHEAILRAKENKGKPSVIVLDTIKGKGVSYTEGKLGNHNMAITAELEATALEELNKAMDDLSE